MTRRWLIALCLSGGLFVAACDATETGNPDLSTGSDAGIAPSLDGGSPPYDAGGWHPHPGSDAGVHASDAGAAPDGGTPPDEDAAVSEQEDAGAH